MPPRFSALVLLAAGLWVLLNLRWCLFVIVRHVAPLRTELEQLLDEAHVDEAFVDARDGSSYSRPHGAGHARQRSAQRAGGNAQPTAKSRVQPVQRWEPGQAAASGVPSHSAREQHGWQPTSLAGARSVSDGDSGRRGGGGGGEQQARAASVGGGGDQGGGGGGREPNPDDAAAALLASKCARGDVRACSNRVEVPINADFNLLAELTREEFAVSPARRIELMMSRYQARARCRVQVRACLRSATRHAPRTSCCYPGLRAAHYASLTLRPPLTRADAAHLRRGGEQAARALAAARARRAAAGCRVRRLRAPPG